jgi:LemA protein
VNLLIVALLLVPVLIILYAIMLYNGLISLKNEVKRAWANIDVLLKQRHDELPKLVKTVEGYIDYEQETLKKVIEARNLYSGASSIGEKAAADSQIHKALGGFFALAEKYPQLRANESFTQLQKRISGLEEAIADRREYFNAAVNQFNTRIEQFPDVLIARQLSYAPQELFEAQASERDDVAIEFKSRKNA